MSGKKVKGREAAAGAVQSICDTCWRQHPEYAGSGPGRGPHRWRGVPPGQCAFCGRRHHSRIYVMADPRRVRYPTEWPEGD